MNSGKTESDFRQFLSGFEPKVVADYIALCKAAWDAAMDATDANAAKVAELATRCRLNFSDRKTYETLIGFAKGGEVRDPILARILDQLILEFRGNMLPPDLIKELSEKESEIDKAFDQFRPELEGKKITDNDIREILGKETYVERRIAVWEASKRVGLVVAPLLKDLVALRNRAAKILGFKNYFEMSYALQELDPNEVVALFADLGARSSGAYGALHEKIDSAACERFKTTPDKLGPWAWNDPFAQEDPLASSGDQDLIFKNKNVIELTAAFYEGIGIPIESVFKRSDLFERENKNPHASCWDIDRRGDVRILANVRHNFQWYGTMMHESGHAAYDVSISKDLPWFLRNAAHILTTEASAMFFEHKAERSSFMKLLLGLGKESDVVLEGIENGARRQRLIFSRWATVVTLFEKGMYEDPDQDLQKLWWDLVEKYQKIRRPAGREKFADYAAKIHVATNSCYYQNYLLADVLVSQLGNFLKEATGTDEVFGNEKAGQILRDNFYGPGSSYHWKELVKRVCGKPFAIDDWLEEVAK